MGSDTLNGWEPPKAVKIAVYLIEKIGIWPILCLVLIGILTGHIQSPSIENRDLIVALSKAFNAHAEEMGELRTINKQICENTSKSELDRQSCRGVWRKISAD